MKKSKLVVMTAILLAILTVGVIFAAIGGGEIYKDKKYVESAETANALIDTFQLNDGSRKYVLRYNVDGEEFTPEYDYDYGKGDYVGKDIKVYYTKGTPQNIFIKTDNKFFKFRSVGIVLIAVCAVIIVAIYIPIAVRKHIIKTGKKELVKINEIVDVIGGYKLLCDSTKIRGRNAAPYKSKTLKQKISKKAVNSAVTVYYLPKHKNFYYVDTNTIKYTEGNK